MDSLQQFYKSKKILITGHTGFKGSWLSLLLKKLGADIVGCALAPEKNRDSLFHLAKIEQAIESRITDIRDFKALSVLLDDTQPELIFHLAAQPLVRDSYEDPLYNYETNVLGTVYLLEAARRLKSLKAFINITTDKCYENKEWFWPYRESDALGGHDPYSASKACSEIVTSSYRKSFFEPLNIGLASARAGNVIGGGDFSKDRIIPDIVNAIIHNKKVILRNPSAVRPWQHILDVLFGYLLLGQKVYQYPKDFSESFNYSPIESTEVSVESIVKKFISIIGDVDYEIDKTKADRHEAQILKLDSSKAFKRLGWAPRYGIEETVVKTALWYQNYLTGCDVGDLCHQELQDFLRLF